MKHYDNVYKHYIITFQNITALSALLKYFIRSLLKSYDSFCEEQCQKMRSLFTENHYLL